MSKRPLSIVIISALFFASGVVGLSYHARELNLAKLFQDQAFWVCVVRVLAIIGGVFLFLGHGWARWLLATWMAYHILLSALHSVTQVLVHTLLFAAIGYFLFSRPASAFLQGAAVPPSSDPSAQ